MYTEKGMTITVPFSIVEKAHELSRKSAIRNKPTTLATMEDTERLVNYIADIVVSIIVQEVGVKKMLK